MQIIIDNSKPSVSSHVVKRMSTLPLFRYPFIHVLVLYNIKINYYRKTYLDDTIWKADLSKKAKNGTVDTAMSGSFRALAID